MPLQFSAAHSSRITKTSQRRNPLLKRSLSSPFNEYRRRKPIERSKSSPNEPADEEELSDGVLEDAKPVRSLADGSHSDDTVAAMQHARSHMFEALPDGGGFNSVRIAEILNYRKSLPPMVTIAHVHALTPSPTRTEKEIATLVKVGKLRRLKTPGRGTGGSSIGDGLCTVEDFGKLIQEMGGLSKDLRGVFRVTGPAEEIKLIRSRSIHGACMQAFYRSRFDECNIFIHRKNKLDARRPSDDSFPISEHNKRALRVCRVPR